MMSAASVGGPLFFARTSGSKALSVPAVLSDQKPVVVGFQILFETRINTIVPSVHRLAMIVHLLQA